LDSGIAYSKLIATIRTRKRAVSVALYGTMALLPTLVYGILAIVYSNVFSTEEYGNYGILAAVNAFIPIVVDFGIPDAALRNYYAERNHELAYLSAVIYGTRIVMFVALPVVGALLYAFWDQLGVQFSEGWILIPSLLVIAYFNRAAELLATICRAIENPVFFSIGQVTNALAMLSVGLVLVIGFDLRIPGALLAIFAAEVVRWLTYEIILSRNLQIPRGRFDWEVMRASLSFGLPLVPTRLAMWSRQLALRPTLANVVPLSAVGLFSFASSIAVIPTLISSAVDLALGPIYFRRREGNESSEFSTKILDFATVYIAGMLPIWVFAIVFCPNIVHLLTSGKYDAAAPVCAVLLCTSFVRMQQPFLQRQIHFLRKTWLLSAITIPFSLLAIALTGLLAGQSGMIAAGWIVLVADLGILIASAMAIQYYENLNYPIGTALLSVTILVLAAIWIMMGSPGAFGWPLLGLKAGLVMFATAASAAIWIWPKRRLIYQLANG
jgi:O-antigen/teichoic acid export membrane protein